MIREARHSYGINLAEAAAAIGHSHYDRASLRLPRGSPNLPYFFDPDAAASRDTSAERRASRHQNAAACRRLLTGPSPRPRREARRGARVFLAAEVPRSGTAERDRTVFLDASPAPSLTVPADDQALVVDTERHRFPRCSHARVDTVARALSLSRTGPTALACRRHPPGTAPPTAVGGSLACSSGSARAVCRRTALSPAAYLKSLTNYLAAVRAGTILTSHHPL